jgi:hypothetical protein
MANRLKNNFVQVVLQLNYGFIKLIFQSIVLSIEYFLTQLFYEILDKLTKNVSRYRILNTSYNCIEIQDTWYICILDTCIEDIAQPWLWCINIQDQQPAESSLKDSSQ